MKTENVRKAIKVNIVGATTAFASIGIMWIILAFASNAVVTNVGFLALVAIGAATFYNKVLRKKKVARRAATVEGWTKIPGFTFMR